MRISPRVGLSHHLGRYGPPTSRESTGTSDAGVVSLGDAPPNRDIYRYALRPRRTVGAVAGLGTRSSHDPVRYQRLTCEAPIGPAGPVATAEIPVRSMWPTPSAGVAHNTSCPRATIALASGTIE